MTQRRRREIFVAIRPTDKFKLRQERHHQEYAAPKGLGISTDLFYKGSVPTELRQTPPAGADVLQETGSAGSQGFAGFSDASQRSWRGWLTQRRMGTRAGFQPLRIVTLYLCRKHNSAA